MWQGFLFQGSPPLLTPVVIAREHALSGRPRPRFDATVFECGPTCPCSESCLNRVVQLTDEFGVSCSISGTLEVFDRGPPVGVGIRTTIPLCCGQFVCEYVGEVISSDIARARAAAAGAAGLKNFIIECRENFGDGSTSSVFVDAASIGGAARFINHACAPALVALPVRVVRAPCEFRHCS
jgi:hypothetical protein